MGETHRLTAADGHELSAYEALPTGTARGTVVVVQEIFGVNGHIRAVCDDFANEGYRAIAPALFDRVERGVEMGYSADEVQRGRGLKERVALDDSLRDVAAAVAKADNKVAVVGYCWGGTVAWAAATRLDGLACASSWYGGGVPELAHEKPRCPVQLHFGETDHSIPMAAVERVRAAQPDVPLFVYPAGHGFGCPERASYHAESAALARERTLELLSRYLG